ncbi:hypothetical protein OJAV_G00109060 [Oryzias javanicus]|uniref:Protein phosphatase 1 regulatory subunit 36 n=1 Tax=Oryzias javanicus TaxID=123683 RepID=A0A3S2P4T4_ORYJA|nr:hypothetical protein OJAV_G00109060 [Oryzias javanicus]
MESDREPSLAVAGIRNLTTEMEAQLKNTDSVGWSPLGRWRWSDETQRMEFVSYCRAEEEDALRRRSQPDTDFLELQLRAEWLAGVHTINHRGRHTRRMSRMETTELETFRMSLMEQQGETVTEQDVKQVAVSLLQDNHTLPIPPCFLDILRSKELDDVITALLLYLSCFFELEPETPAASSRSDSENVASDQKKNSQIWSEIQGAQRKLAICYFNLMTGLQTEKLPQNLRIHKCFNKMESLLHASLYSFLCCVAWVAFRRTHMKEIQHEVGRLLYSDTFNAAIKEKMNEKVRGNLSCCTGQSKNFTGPQPCGLAAIPFDDLSAAFAQRPIPPSVYEEPGAETGLAMDQPLFPQSFDGAVEGAASFQQFLHSWETSQSVLLQQPETFRGTDGNPMKRRRTLHQTHLFLLF